MSAGKRAGTDPWIGQVLQGRYRIIKRLGEGGMGTVYLAEQLSIGRNVAVKVLHAHYARDEEFVSRFRREARQAAAINHHRAVTIYEFGHTDDDSLFIVMEYVAGTTLKSILQHAGTLPVVRAVRLGQQLAEVLQAAHDAGIVHRDIKPENIMVRKGDELKLMDFGIARMQDAHAQTKVTRTGMMIGTPEYMAPEQIEGKEISGQTDLYAWGIVMYEMLTGETPFTAPAPAALLVKQLQENPQPLRKLRGGIAKPLERVVMQALEKQPQQRQRNMGEVIATLRMASDEDEEEKGGGGHPRHVQSGKDRRWMQYGLVLLGTIMVSAVIVWFVAVREGNLFMRETTTSTPATDLNTGESPPRATKSAEGPSGAVVAPNRGNVEMVSVPAGSFFMGCNESIDNACDDDEKPGRQVYVATFAIDKTEVTVAAYRRCVEDGPCSAAETREGCNWQVNGRESHPINCIDWNQARTYCEWARKRLPSEAEWEKAARGTDGRTYPWGTAWDARKANVKGAEDGYGMTAPVGVFLTGASPYGALDMVGNVWEWTADWYETGKTRAVRGGAWGNHPLDARASLRYWLDPGLRYENFGMRCAQ